MRSAGNVSDGRGLEGGAAQKELGGGGLGRGEGGKGPLGRSGDDGLICTAPLGCKLDSDALP